MDEETKKDFIQLFNLGFEEVVLPQIESLREEMTIKFNDVRSEKATKIDEVRGEMATGFNDVRSEMATKEDVRRIEKRLIGVEEKVKRVDDKLDKVALDHTQQFTQHAQRLKRLESQSTIG